MLRSDRLIVLAPRAVTRAYLLIVPRLDGGEPPQSFSSAAPDLLDELRYVRSVIADFYRERYGSAGMSFEMVADEVCSRHAGQRTNCFGAHLGCLPLGDDVAARMGPTPEIVDGLHDLSATRRPPHPHLYVERVELDRDAPENSAARERWSASVVPLGPGPRPGAWRLVDLVAHMSTPAGPSDAGAAFAAWLRAQGGLEGTDPTGVPTIDFRGAVVEANRAAYDNMVEKYARTWDEKQLQNTAIARFLEPLDAAVKVRPRVLDLACGPGMYRAAFAARSLYAVGSDISFGMLAYASRVARSAPGSVPPPLICTNNAQLAFRDGSFDGIWFSAALLHIPHGAAADIMAELRRILVEGGILYVSTQVGHGMVKRFEGRVFFYYSEGDLGELFAHSRFTPLDQWDGITDRGTYGDTRRKYWKHYVLRRDS